MKLLKSQFEMKAKRKKGMTDEEAVSYEEYKKMDHNPTGADGDVLKIDDVAYYQWVFYEEVPDDNTKKQDKKKNYKVHFHEQIEEERYEWFCAGWTQFYDDVVRTIDLGGMEHKLFFYWERKDVPGVAIYVNDEKAAKYKDVTIKLKYEPPAYVGDPPSPPPPPPPSAK
jgi:hypothetical protein